MGLPLNRAVEVVFEVTLTVMQPFSDDLDDARSLTQPEQRLPSNSATFLWRGVLSANFR